MSEAKVAGATATAPTVRTRSVRVVVFAVGILVVAVLLALIGGARRDLDPLDPTDAGAKGSLAVVEVLRQHGVDVSIVRSARQLPQLQAGTTLVVGNPKYFGKAAAAKVRTATSGGGVRVVLVMPTAKAISQLGYPIQVLPGSEPDPVSGTCRTTEVAETDQLLRMSARLVPLVGAQGCFPYPVPAGTKKGSNGYGMVKIAATATQPEIIAAGLSDALSNRRILEADNAGVAVRLLGQSARLVWYQPDGSDDDATSTNLDPWPAWQWPAAGVIALAFVVFSVAIGRRFGRLVPEPLPVVVKAAETAEARARLYQRAHDSRRAGVILRYGTIRRLRRRLGSDVPPGDLTAEPTLIVRVADVTGLPPGAVADLLAGPLPTTDADLVLYSQHLADLEEKAIRS